MTGNHTTGALLAMGATRLAASGSDTPHLEAELLLAHARGQSRARLKSHPEEIPDAAQSTRYEALIERRAAGEPLAYIVGFKDFWTLRLAVTPAVLVPRPETELLVERALALRPDATGRVVDLGTGSGAIALALASERPRWQVTATDVSGEALAVALLNAASHGLPQVEWLRGSWFEPLAGRRFDLIVSNPPYIGEGEPQLAAAELRREPRGALSPGADALASLRAIVRSAPDHLGHGGWLLLEHGATQAADLASELVGRGFRHVRSHRDLAGHERATEGQWAAPHGAHS
jgi:release factor glutamine methyltransferase